MTAYMIHCVLPGEFTEEFIALIPAHRARVNELMREGKIVFYTLALDRTAVWAGLLAENEAHAREILSTLPLQKYFDVRVHPTAFMEVTGTAQPHFSLN